MPKKRTAPYQASHIQERLAWLRDNLWGGSQIEMARETGLYQATLSNLLRGKHKPSGKLLEKIAKHPRVNRVWLLTGEGEPLLDSLAAPVAGEAALHVAKALFEGMPHDSPGCLEHYLLPVHRSLFRSSRYWIIVGKDHPLATFDSLRLAVGDQVLFESDPSGWPTELAGLPCIAWSGRGKSKSLAYYLMSKSGSGATEPIASKGKDKRSPGGRKQRAIMLDDSGTAAVRPSKRAQLTSKNIVAVGIYREGSLSNCPFAKEW